MAPASVPAARTFSPPFSRTIARIIPGKLVERSFSSVCVYFILSFFFLLFVFSLRSIEDQARTKEKGGEKEGKRWRFFLIALERNIRLRFRDFFNPFANSRECALCTMIVSTTGISFFYDIHYRAIINSTNDKLESLVTIRGISMQSRPVVRQWDFMETIVQPAVTKGLILIKQKRRKIVSLCDITSF